MSLQWFLFFASSGKQFRITKPFANKPKFGFGKSETTIPELGAYLARKSTSKAGNANKTNIGKSGISELTRDQIVHLGMPGFYPINLAVDVDPSEVIKGICKTIS